MNKPTSEIKYYKIVVRDCTSIMQKPRVLTYVRATSREQALKIVKHLCDDSWNSYEAEEIKFYE